MVRLELLDVKPVPDLAATEMVLTVSVLPLRLHVDQDALDFITRFFFRPLRPTGMTFFSFLLRGLGFGTSSSISSSISGSGATGSGSDTISTSSSDCTCGAGFGADRLVDAFST